MERSALIVYVPVIHQGYVSLVKDALARNLDVYVLADEFVSIQEIRALSADMAVNVLRSIFGDDRIHVLGANIHEVFSTYDVFELANDDVVREFSQYLPNGVRIVETTGFLRWDATQVFSKSDVHYDRVSTDRIDLDRMWLAVETARDVADWWRQVGVMLVAANGEVITGHNRHLPTEHTVYIDGDPRDVIPAGTHSDLSTALHGEPDVICQAARLGISTVGALIYVSVFPCPVCAKLIAASGIAAVYFASGHASLDGESVLRAAGVELIYVKTPS